MARTTKRQPAQRNHRQRLKQRWAVLSRRQGGSGAGWPFAQESSSASDTLVALPDCQSTHECVTRNQIATHCMKAC